MTEAQLLLEIDYTPIASACRDPLLTDYGQVVLCRRQVRHEGVHATRLGAGAIVWDEDEDDEETGTEAGGAT